jgi:hypothetical protein
VIVLPRAGGNAPNIRAKMKRLFSLPILSAALFSIGLALPAGADGLGTEQPISPLPDK